MGRGKYHGGNRSKKRGGGLRLDKADPLLVRRIGEVIGSESAAGGTPLTSEVVFVKLLQRFVEYRRENKNKVQDVIHQILVNKRRAIDATSASAGSDQGELGRGNSSDSECDDAPDTHNMLNSSLYGGDKKRPRTDDGDITPGNDSSASFKAFVNSGCGSALPSPASTISAGARLKKEEASLLNSNKKRKRGRPQNGSSSQQQQQAPKQQVNIFSSRNDVQAERPKVRFADMGGIESCLQDVRELCSYPLTHPEIYRHLGVDPPRGILLHGPPGCGKTMLARAIAGEMGVSFFSVSAPEMVSGMSGESEEKVRALFESAKQAAPSIIFIDEIDAITGKRDSSSRGMERRIVAQLLTCMDSLQLEKRTKHRANADGSGGACAPTQEEEQLEDGKPNEPEESDEEDPESEMRKHTVLVLGATNRPDSLDPALRRAGRFDREIAMGIPDAAAREHILTCITRKMRLTGDFSFAKVAQVTPGYVGADLDALAKESAVVAVNRVFSHLICDGPVTETPGEGSALERRAKAGLALQKHSEPFAQDKLDSIFVTMEDFMEAVKKVQPSAKREGFATVPSVTWNDIGSLVSVREELSMAITEPIKNPERFRRMGLSAPAGVLLYGPPGCGKTLLAKAIANSSGSNFISVKGPELLNKYVGESERAVRQVFSRARASAPCIVFFDELDSLCPRRGSDGSNGVSERVVNQLLTEMDGLEERRSVFVVAATNRPDIIDPAMLRPGRLDKLLFVPLPKAQDRVDILETCARGSPIAANVDLEIIARDEKLEGYTGADLASLTKEAAVHALRRIAASAREDGAQHEEQIEQADFEHAMQTVLPSVSAKDQHIYQKMTAQLRKVRKAGKTDTSDNKSQAC